MGTLRRLLLLITAATLIFLSSSVQQVESSGTLQLRLRTFSNLEGRDSTGGCCSGQQGADGSCRGVCSVSFRICIQHYQATVDPKQPCIFGEFFTQVLESNSSTLLRLHETNISDPIDFDFDFTWPKTFSMIIEAWHSYGSKESQNEDTGGGYYVELTLFCSERRQRAFRLNCSPPAIGSNESYPLGSQILMVNRNLLHLWRPYLRGGNSMLVSRFIAQRSLEVHPEWTRNTLTTNHSSLEIMYRVQCETNYYGQNCGTLCRPRDDKFGHYTCRSDGEKACMPGWRGDYCDRAMCLLGCHESHGFCDEPNECKCRPGWEGSLCDTCTRYPGCIHGTCFRPWQCNCNEGWGGLFCDQDLNYCTNHKPCKNGGTCTNTGHGSYTCSCAEEYMGKNCDRLRNPCVENPCQNGGACQNPEEGNFTCQCAPGFFGPRCETSASICTDNPCDNGGTCVHDPGGFICACPSGFYGIHCEKSSPSCEENFCLNGGTCIDRPEGPVCHCLNSFIGVRCEETSKCVDNSCLNGGSCYDYENSFRCSCAPGFAGPLCQLIANKCSLRPCTNGGTCHDLINDYNCDCVLGFHGKNCSLRVASCSSSPCKNNAVCLDKPGGYLCHCAHGYYGSHCEFHLQSNVHLQKKPTNEDLSTARSTVVSNVSHQVSDDDEGLSGSQVALIATISTVLPILAVLAVAVVLALRRCRQQRENIPKDFEPKEEEDEQLQNERNSMHMNNKCVHHTKIFNTLDRIPAKVTNEVPAKVLNTDVGSNKLSENKNLVCVQRTLDRKDHSSGYLDNSHHQSIDEWSPSNGVFVIEDHFRSPPTLDTETDVFATEV